MITRKQICDRFRYRNVRFVWYSQDNRLTNPFYKKKMDIVSAAADGERETFLKSIYEIILDKGTF